MAWILVAVQGVSYGDIADLLEKSSHTLILCMTDEDSLSDVCLQQTPDQAFGTPVAEQIC